MSDRYRRDSGNDRKRSREDDDNYRGGRDSRDRDDSSKRYNTNNDKYNSNSNRQSSNDNRKGFNDNGKPRFDDSVDRETEELFVGNVQLRNESELSLQNFLNNAMKQVGLARTPNPIIGVRMSNKFCFISFRNSDDCTQGLNLNGIVFNGSPLRICRPAKYKGQLTNALTWQQISGETDRSETKKFVSPLTSDANTKNYREIFVGNTDPDMSEVGMRDFLGGALQKMGMSNSGVDNPVLQVRVSGKFAFLEMRTAEDAANVLNLNEVPFMGTNIKLCRPAKYDGGSSVGFYDWDELYALWTSGDLKLMTAGLPSRVIVISNMATAQELADPLLYLDIIEDTRGECSQYGTVRSVIVPRSPVQQSAANLASVVGKVFVEMTTVQQATNVLLALKGRTFDNRSVDVKFYPDWEFSRNDYTCVDPPIIVTKSHGPVGLDKVLNSAAMDKIHHSLARMTN